MIVYEYWYEGIKPKYGDKPKLCYIDTKDTSNYGVDRPLHIGKNEKVIELMKDKLSRKIMTEIVALRPMMHCYLTNDENVDKKAKDRKKCVIKEEIELQDYKECLENYKPMLRSQRRFRSEAHNLFTEKFIKLALSANDDKRTQISVGVTTCLYGYGY